MDTRVSTLFSTELTPRVDLKTWRFLGRTGGTGLDAGRKGPGALPRNRVTPFEWRKATFVSTWLHLFLDKESRNTRLRGRR